MTSIDVAAVVQVPVADDAAPPGHDPLPKGEVPASAPPPPHPTMIAALAIASIHFRLFIVSLTCWFEIGLSTGGRAIGHYLGRQENKQFGLRRRQVRGLEKIAKVGDVAEER